MPAGRPRMVYAFATRGSRLTAIDLIGDPERLGEIDLVVPDV